MVSRPGGEFGIYSHTSQNQPICSVGFLMIKVFPEVIVKWMDLVSILINGLPLMVMLTSLDTFSNPTKEFILYKMKMLFKSILVSTTMIYLTTSLPETSQAGMLNIKLLMNLMKISLILWTLIY